MIDLMNMRWFKLAMACGVLSIPCGASASESEELATAKETHQSIVTLDTHVDFSLRNFTHDRNISKKLKGVQFDLPKMEEGEVDAAFFVVYVSQKGRSVEGYKNAYDQAIKKFTAIHNLTSEWSPERIALALTSSDVEEIIKSGKKVALIGVENAYPIGLDLRRVDEFYNRGARYMGIMHNGHNQFGDSNFPKGEDAAEIHGGLSPLGVELVAKLNEAGIVVDISHASKNTRLDIIRHSRVPVVDTHSALSAFYNHPRNIDDEVLDALVEKGGVIQLVAFQSYLKETPDWKLDAINALARSYEFPDGNMWTEGNKIFKHFSKASQEQAEGYWRDFQDLERSMPHANVKDLVDQIDYVVENYGIDHVGVSSDFGGGGGIDGWQDASETFGVTLALIKRGYTEDEIEKIWSGNYLRVWRAAESYRQGN